MTFGQGAQIAQVAAHRAAAAQALGIGCIPAGSVVRRECAGLGGHRVEPDALRLRLGGGEGGGAAAGAESGVPYGVPLAAGEAQGPGGAWERPGADRGEASDGGAAWGPAQPEGGARVLGDAGTFKFLPPLGVLWAFNTV